MAEEKLQKSYWAILPAPVRYDPNLSPAAKILYAEISSLTNEVGYCFASNGYFMNLYGMAERTLQRHLKALADGGYIQIQDGDGGSGRRKIFAGILPIPPNPVKNDGVTPSKMAPNPVKNGANNKDNNKKSGGRPSVPGTS